MSSDLSTNRKQTRRNPVTRWDGAIYEAELQIGKARARIECLTVAIHRFKDFRDSGEPWPGEVTDSTASDIAA
jgi:hypothetical protein